MNKKNSALYLNSFIAISLASSSLTLANEPTLTQPELNSRVKPTIEHSNYLFRDLNGNGKLDTYEDWRLPNEERVSDLVSRMTLAEKAGLMLIDTMNASCDGAIPLEALNYINQQNMHRFIFRNLVTATPTCSPDQGFRAGSSLTPEQAALYTNAIQELSEATRLGIPSLFKSNARNHYERDARTGINEAAGSFTEFPKEAGLTAATLGHGDMSIIERFSEVMSSEWRSIGLRSMYGYMADLSTEPRWYRVHETFTEDSQQAASIMRALVEGLQGGPLSPDSGVALTMKHFPGGGPQEMGLDPHYSFGKHQVYPSDNFGYHLAPWRAAIEAGVSAVMPYYGVPIEVAYNGETYEQTGMAFSKQIVADLLRGELGFDGYVNSDTGIINSRAWGLEEQTVQERVAAAINGGTDTLSGFNDKSVILELVESGLVTETRITEAAERLLKPLFELGLFENPYVDATQAERILGSPENTLKGIDAQRQSIVLLQNTPKEDGSNLLPLNTSTSLYTLGLAPDDVKPYGFEVIAGDANDSEPRPNAAGFDHALIRIAVSNPRDITSAYASNDPTTGMNPEHLNPLTGQPWGAEDRCVVDDEPLCTDDALRFGGALPWEQNNLSFTTMAASESWQISPSLETIQAVMDEIGAENTILSIYFRQPYVLDQESGLREAGAILANFGVSSTALLDVISGQVLATGEPIAPQGRMPFSLANNLQAVIDNASDAPGYPEEDTLFPYNFGLGY